MHLPRASLLAVLAVLIISVSAVVACAPFGEGQDVVSRNVSTWDEMKDALEDQTVGEIKMTANITAEETVTMRANLTIDACNHKLKAGSEMSGNLIEITNDGCTLKNMDADNDDRTTGILVSNAKNVSFVNIKIQCSCNESCALTVDTSSVSISSKFELADNGYNESGPADGDYIHLAWSDSSVRTGKCSLTFDPDGRFPVYQYDHLNVAIKPADLANAGVTSSTWDQRFSVKDGDDDLCHKTYGTLGNRFVVFNNGIAKVGEERFASINDAAVAAMSSGKVLEITQDCVGEGLVLPDGHPELVIDLGEMRYIIDNPLGVTCDVEKYFEFGTGGKVTIKNGTIDSYMPLTSLTIDTECDTYFEDVMLYSDSLTPSYDPYGSSNKYSLSIRGGTTVFNGIEIQGDDRTTPDDGRSVILRGNGAHIISMGMDKFIGHFDVTGYGSSIDIHGQFMIMSGELGRDYHMNLESGSVALHPGCMADADIHHGSGSIQFFSTGTESGVEITSSPFAIRGDLALCGESGSVCLGMSVSDAMDGMVADIVLGKGYRMTLITDVRIDGDIVLMPGSAIASEDNSLYSKDGLLHIIMYPGSFYDETEVKSTHVYAIDANGSLTEQIRVQFVAIEHASGFSYRGISVEYIEHPLSDGAYIIDLSRLSVKVDGDYELRGWDVNGTVFGLNDVVTIDGNTVVKPVIEEKSGNVPISVLSCVLLAMSLAIIAIYARSRD